MGVLLVNGSPHKAGNTARLLGVVEEALSQDGVSCTWFQLGSKPVRGCIDCERCEGTGRCVFSDDCANGLIDAILAADGIVVGSPVYYGAPNGALCAVLDRACYAGDEHGPGFAGRPAAAVVSAWRAGSTTALDRLYRYFLKCGMPIVTSYYWSQGFDGRYAGEPDGYADGVMAQLGHNMASALRGGAR